MEKISESCSEENVNSSLLAVWRRGRLDLLRIENTISEIEYNDMCEIIAHNDPAELAKIDEELRRISPDEMKAQNNQGETSQNHWNGKFYLEDPTHQGFISPKEKSPGENNDSVQGSRLIIGRWE